MRYSVNDAVLMWLGETYDERKRYLYVFAGGAAPPVTLIRCFQIAHAPSRPEPNAKTDAVGTADKMGADPVPAGRPLFDIESLKPSRGVPRSINRAAFAFPAKALVVCRQDPPHPQGSRR